MFKFLFKDKVINIIVDKITSNVQQSLQVIQTNQDTNFDKVINHLEALRIEVKTLESRLNTKEIKDKMNYGQTQYKISSLQSQIKGN